MTLVVLTGATRGIGRAAAIELASKGAELAIVGREPQRVKAVANEATATGGGAPVHQHVADLTLMSEVRTLADELRARHDHIDVLANNAGALFASRQTTAEGFERTFALNHLAPFLLTNLLRDRLAGGRVVATASDAHKSGRLDLDDLQSEKSYAAMRVYGTSKLCNILFTRELARRLSDLGVTANSFSPGFVATRFGDEAGGVHGAFMRVAKRFAKRPQQGAETLVWLASSPDLKEVSGEYFYQGRRGTLTADAQDDDLARRLWTESEAIALKVSA